MFQIAAVTAAVSMLSGIYMPIGGVVTPDSSFSVTATSDAAGVSQSEGDTSSLVSLLSVCVTSVPGQFRTMSSRVSESSMILSKSSSFSLSLVSFNFLRTLSFCTE